MDAAEDAIAAARIAAAKDEDDLDSEDESYLDNEEIAHRQNMVGRTPSSSLRRRGRRLDEAHAYSMKLSASAAKLHHRNADGTATTWVSAAAVPST